MSERRKPFPDKGLPHFDETGSRIGPGVANPMNMHFERSVIAI